MARLGSRYDKHTLTYRGGIVPAAILACTHWLRRRALCRRLEIRQSMGRVRSCFDNAAAESFFISLEWKELSQHAFDSTTNARTTVIDWCYGFYNHQRRHSAAAGLVPINYETAVLTRDAA